MGIYDADSLPQPEEIVVLPTDTEAKLRIISADEGLSNNSGLAWMRFGAELVDHPNAKDVTIFVTFPDANLQEPKKYAGTYKSFDAFRRAFGIAGKFQPEDLIGKEGWAILKQKEDGEYGMKNEVKRWTSK